MEDTGKKRSILIPIIYALFFLCITAGGVLLIVYAFFRTLSEPWHPVAAFALIGTTWICWLLTYIYSCIKHCFRRDDPQNVARQTTRKAEPNRSPSDHPHDEKQDSPVAAA